MPTIIPIPGAGSAERVKENMTLVDMSKDDMAEIDKILASFPQTGARYVTDISWVQLPIYTNGTQVRRSSGEADVR